MFRPVARLAGLGIAATALFLSPYVRTDKSVDSVLPEAFKKCENVSCHSRSELKDLFGKRRASTQTSATTSTIEPSSVTSGPVATQSKPERCPLSIEELGSATWSLLHTMAANYPENPTPEDKQAAQQFISALTRLYPCPHCRVDFVHSATSHPLQCDSRRQFVLWVCEQHNIVNRKLGKAEKACVFEELDVAWRTGDAKCWED